MDSARIDLQFAVFSIKPIDWFVLGKKNYSKSFLAARLGFLKGSVKIIQLKNNQCE